MVSVSPRCSSSSACHRTPCCGRSSASTSVSSWANSPSSSCRPSSGRRAACHACLRSCRLPWRWSARSGWSSGSSICKQCSPRGGGERPDHGVVKGCDLPAPVLLGKYTQAEFLVGGQGSAVGRDKATQLIRDMYQGDVRAEKADRDVERPV